MSVPESINTKQQSSSTNYVSMSKVILGEFTSKWSSFTHTLRNAQNVPEDIQTCLNIGDTCYNRACATLNKCETDKTLDQKDLSNYFCSFMSDMNIAGHEYAKAFTLMMKE